LGGGHAFLFNGAQVGHRASSGALEEVIYQLLGGNLPFRVSLPLKVREGVLVIVELRHRNGMLLFVGCCVHGQLVSSSPPRLWTEQPGLVLSRIKSVREILQLLGNLHDFVLNLSVVILVSM